MFSKTASGLKAAAENSTEEEPDQRHARRIWSSRHQGPMKRSTLLNRSHSLRLGWSFFIVSHDMDDEEDHDTLFLSDTFFFLNCKALCWQQEQLENSFVVSWCNQLFTTRMKCPSLVDASSSHDLDIQVWQWWSLGHGQIHHILQSLNTHEYHVCGGIKKMQIFWHNCVVFGLWLGMITPVSLNDCFVWHLCSFLIIQLLKWESLLWNCQNPKWTLVFARCAWLCVFLFCCLCVSVFWISFSK